MVEDAKQMKAWDVLVDGYPVRLIDGHYNGGLYVNPEELQDLIDKGVAKKQIIGGRICVVLKDEYKRKDEK